MWRPGFRHERTGQSNVAAGLGKTTLAHIVAKHCGYRPLEINASDDRTAAAFHEKITNAAEMKSVIGSKQPNCIIVDEIDGAAGLLLIAYIAPGYFTRIDKAPSECIL